MEEVLDDYRADQRVAEKLQPVIRRKRRARRPRGVMGQRLPQQPAVLKADA